jgi:hypothetical protein
MIHVSAVICSLQAAGRTMSYSHQKKVLTPVAEHSALHVCAMGRRTTIDTGQVEYVSARPPSCRGWFPFAGESRAVRVSCSCWLNNLVNPLHANFDPCMRHPEQVQFMQDASKSGAALYWDAFRFECPLLPYLSVVISREVKRSFRCPDPSPKLRTCQLSLKFLNAMGGP